VGECLFWYRPTRVVPDQRQLNGRCCRCCTAASDESAQPDDNTEQNQAPSECTTNVPCIPENSCGKSRLQPEQVPQPVAEPPTPLPPPVRTGTTVQSIMLLVYLTCGYVIMVNIMDMW